MMLRRLRFVAIVLGALAMAISFWHLMEFPTPRSRYNFWGPEGFAAVGLQAIFLAMGLLIDMLAVAAVALLAYFVRKHRRPGSGLALDAAILYAISVIHWWAVFASWPYRAEWQPSHLLLMLITFGGFVALTASVLADSFPPVEERVPLP